MRSLSALFLSVVLALASVSMAVARGQAPMGEAFTICSAEGSTVIVLDADGNPQPMAPHLCPDCISAATVFILAPGPALPARPVSNQAAEWRVAQPLQTSTEPVISHARDPPTLSV